MGIGGCVLAALAILLVFDGNSDAAPVGSHHAKSGPITEVGGGGPTFPQQAVNGVWGLSSQRATCTVCHEVQPGTKDVVQAVFRRPFYFNKFGAAYRKVLFNEVARGANNIFDPTQQQRERATRWPSLVRADSDGDGYSNEVELRFGSLPGVRASHPARAPRQLDRWNAIITRALHGKQLSNLERDPRVLRAGADTDGDGVPDSLEHFAGFNPRNAHETPLVAARRLAVYRQLLLDAGMHP
jgi:hypothetical protein